MLSEQRGGGAGGGESTEDRGGGVGGGESTEDCGGGVGGGESTEDRGGGVGAGESTEDRGGGVGGRRIYFSRGVSLVGFVRRRGRESVVMDFWRVVDEHKMFVRLLYVRCENILSVRSSARNIMFCVYLHRS